MAGPDAMLRRLARLHGVQPVYVDAMRRRRSASREALLAVLRALGAPVEREQDVAAALAERERAVFSPGIEPVLVAWDGKVPAFELRRAWGSAGDLPTCRIRLESGEALELRVLVSAAPAAVVAAGAVDHPPPAGQRVEPEPLRLPPGYHRLEVDADGRSYSALLIAAPRRAYLPAAWTDGGARDWGVFLPLYALEDHPGSGPGDLSSLGRLAEWTHTLGGRVVGTLPLFAALLDSPFEPGPYSPASRLFWNELYADPLRAPGLDDCADALAALDSPSRLTDLERLGTDPLINYHTLVRARRAVLRPLAACFFDSGGADSPSFRRFLAERPEAEAFARFMATCERRGEAWASWPVGPRDGTIRPGDYDERARQYHLYVQWLLDGQLRTLAAGLRERGQRLYLDMPLGVHPAGYDVWSRRGIFATGASAGSPPDAFFSLGQNWGFPPLHPEALRETRYAYLIDALRTSFRFAGMLRIDHVMALHRVFWVPDGMEAAEGVYVRYPAHELYAIHCLESVRHASVVVGEDLGTVPTEVRRAMARHGFQRMWVLEFETSPDRVPPVTSPVPGSVASVGTHDTPTFAAFWEALDVTDREDLGLLDAGAAAAEREGRAKLREAVIRMLRDEGWLDTADPSTLQALRACLARMAAGPARLLLVNLEDLWGEVAPQNVPGTSIERPNWRRKARMTFNEFSGLPEVVDTLAEIQRLRSRTGKT